MAFRLTLLILGWLTMVALLLNPGAFAIFHGMFLMLILTAAIYQRQL